MMGDTMFSVLAIIPILFWLAVFVLIIMLIIRLSKNKSGQANEVLYQKLADSEQLQREMLRRQQELSIEVKEVSDRLQRIEKTLKEVE